jgi:pectinesterase
MKKITFLIAFTLLVFCSGAQSVAFDFVVAADGSGDFKTVQEAINAVPDFRKNPTRILIRKGVYKEKLTLPTSKTNVAFVGEDRDQTILTYDDFASKKNRFGETIGTTGSSSFFVFGDGFSAENLTFENSAGPVGQAVAVRVTADQVSFRNCRFLGFQDTLYPQGNHSRQYYRDCYIEGTVDFIFGWSIAVFENCTLFGKQAGYFTAASTLPESKYGFVFLNCKITGEGEGTFYLGRPWRPYANVAYLNCEIGRVVKPEGWDNWGNPENEKTARYVEFGNRGAGAPIGSRVTWSKQLSEKEAAEYTPEKIFSAQSTSPAFDTDWMPELAK